MPESLNAEKQSSIRWVLVSDENLRKVKLSLSQIGEKNIFSFPGSRYFFDYLSREGPGGVEKYLSLHEKSSWKKSIVIINHANRKKANQLENVLRKAELARDNESKTKRTKASKSNILKEDREYFKNLEKNLLTDSNPISVDQVKSSILKTVKNANDFLQERELFWMYFD